MPVSGPWYEWLTSFSISSAVRLSPGAKGWFQAVKMKWSGSGQECYRSIRSQQGRAKDSRRTYCCDLVQLALNGEAERIKV